MMLLFFFFFLPPALLKKCHYPLCLIATLTVPEYFPWTFVATWHQCPYLSKSIFCHHEYFLSWGFPG